MWHRARAAGGCLPALGQLSRLSRRYKIEKIQRLSANFEKACWRTVRCAEERAYHQKYAFMRHCVNVINYRGAQQRQRRVPLAGVSSQLACEFSGDNGALLQSKVESHLARLASELPRGVEAADAAALGGGPSQKAGLLRRLRELGLGACACERALCGLSEIARLQRLDERLRAAADGGGASGRGYARHELEAMVG